MLYILTGLPYAGKTTLTNELVQRFGFIVVSTDDIIDESNFEVKDMSQSDWNDVYSEAYARLREYLSQKKTVVLDSANLKKSERDTAREIAKSCKSVSRVIYINTSKPEILNRRNQNQETKERGHVHEEVLKIALSLFEEPTAEENIILFNSSMNLNQWVNENVRS